MTKQANGFDKLLTERPNCTTANRRLLNVLLLTRAVRDVYNQWPALTSRPHTDIHRESVWMPSNLRATQRYQSVLLISLVLPLGRSHDAYTRILHNSESFVYTIIIIIDNFVIFILLLYIKNTNNTETKHNQEKAKKCKTLQNKTIGLPWFSRHLRHSARKRSRWASWAHTGWLQVQQTPSGWIHSSMFITIFLSTLQLSPGSADTGCSVVSVADVALVVVVCGDDVVVVSADMVVIVSCSITDVVVSHSIVVIDVVVPVMLSSVPVVNISSSPLASSTSTPDPASSPTSDCPSSSSCGENVCCVTSTDVADVVMFSDVVTVLSVVKPESSPKSKSLSWPHQQAVCRVWHDQINSCSMS